MTKRREVENEPPDNGAYLSSSRPAAADIHAASPEIGETDLITNRLLIAIAWIKARKVRDEAFEERLFSDPAWDMILDLYVNHVQGNRLCISDLCLATSAPPTTALRYIAMLENRGLVVREPDPADRRRVYLFLTPIAKESTDRALDRAAEEDRRLGLGRLRTFN